MPGQNDVLLRNARCHQLVGNGAVRPVVLNPDLAVANVKVQHAAVDAIDAIPARVHQLVMILRLVDDDLDLYLAARRPKLRVLMKDLLEDGAISV